jgi:hypothetical protein
MHSLTVRCVSLIPPCLPYLVSHCDPILGSLNRTREQLLQLHVVHVRSLHWALLCPERNWLHMGSCSVVSILHHVDGCMPYSSCVCMRMTRPLGPPLGAASSKRPHSTEIYSQMSMHAKIWHWQKAYHQSESNFIYIVFSLCYHCVYTGVSIIRLHYRTSNLDNQVIGQRWVLANLSKFQFHFVRDAQR